MSHGGKKDPGKAQTQLVVLEGGGHAPERGAGSTNAEPLDHRAVKAKIIEALKAGQLESNTETALVAELPDAVLNLTPEERQSRVRQGAETLILAAPRGPRPAGGAPNGSRGFVKTVLKVPLGHPQARTYGVYVEVDKEGYAALKRAFNEKVPTTVKGRLANKLPLLEEAYETWVVVEEDGSEMRARVVDAEHPLILDGPDVGMG
jgi:hypothetical protein